MALEERQIGVKKATQLTIRNTAPSKTAFILTSRSIGTVNKHSDQIRRRQ